MRQGIKPAEMKAVVDHAFRGVRISVNDIGKRYIEAHLEDERRKRAGSTIRVTMHRPRRGEMTSESKHYTMRKRPLKKTTSGTVFATIKEHERS